MLADGGSIPPASTRKTKATLFHRVAFFFLAFTMSLIEAHQIHNIDSESDDLLNIPNQRSVPASTTKLTTVAQDPPIFRV